MEESFDQLNTVEKSTRLCIDLDIETAAVHLSLEGEPKSSPSRAVQAWPSKRGTQSHAADKHTRSTEFDAIVSSNPITISKESGSLFPVQKLEVPRPLSRPCLVEGRSPSSIEADEEFHFQHTCDGWKPYTYKGLIQQSDRERICSPCQHKGKEVAGPPTVIPESSWRLFAL